MEVFESIFETGAEENPDDIALSKIFNILCNTFFSFLFLRPPPFYFSFVKFQNPVMLFLSSESNFFTGVFFSSFVHFYRSFNV